jgi:acyl carrier protein
MIGDYLGIPEDRITSDLNLIGEIDSPDHVELIMQLEEEFDITIPVVRMKTREPSPGAYLITTYNYAPCP